MCRTKQPPYLASLLHLSDIPRQLRSSISQQLIVPKTQLKLGKHAFSVAARGVWNELPITLESSEATFHKNSKHIYSKLHFCYKSSVVPCSGDDFCASLFTITLNDSGMRFITRVYWSHEASVNCLMIFFSFFLLVDYHNMMFLVQHCILINTE